MKRPCILDDEARYYQRTVSRERTTLGEQVAKLYVPDVYTEVMASGMNALMLTMQMVADRFRREPVTVLFSNEMYCDTTHELLPYLARVHLHFTVIPFDVRDTAGMIRLLEAHKNTLACVLVESCSNPNGFMPEWKELRYVSLACEYQTLRFKPRMRKEALLVVDNSWLTGVMFNPFEHGADAVVDSGAKYLSSAQIICGFISTQSRSIHRELRALIKIYGIHVSERDCEVVSHALVSLEPRIKSAYERTVRFLAYLEKHVDPKRIDCVNHPVKNGVTAPLLAHGPAVVSLHVISPRFRHRTTTKGEKVADATLETVAASLGEVCKAHKLPYYTSYGHNETTLDCWPHADITGVWVRIAFGHYLDVASTEPEDAAFARWLALLHALAAEH